MERESKNTPPLEENFYRWLTERKKVWRLQRLTRKHSGGRGLLGQSSHHHHRGDGGGFSGGQGGGTTRVAEGES